MFSVEHSVPYSPVQIPQNLHINGREDIILMVVCKVNNNMCFVTQQPLWILKQFKNIFNLDLLLCKKTLEIVLTH